MKASQMELFSPAKEVSAGEDPRSAGFLSRIRNYERVILGVIIFIVFGAVAYSFGVERGKNAFRSENFKRQEVAGKTALPHVKPLLPPKSQGVIKSADTSSAVPAQQPVIKRIVPAQPLPQKSTGSYTVQVATYKNNSAAQKEARRLRTKGLESLVLVKGEYSVVCIGSFTEKNKAQAELLKIKNQYQYKDCILRRL